MSSYVVIRSNFSTRTPFNCCKRLLRSHPARPLSSHSAVSIYKTQAFTRPSSQIIKRPTAMSYSNTDTGGKAADPYTEKNLENPSLKDKVEGLNHFIDKSKVSISVA